jgi:hypothetical protein
VPKDEARRIAANIAKPPELLQLNGVKLVIAGRRSYPTFPPPLRVSYSIQIPPVWYTCVQDPSEA